VLLNRMMSKFKETRKRNLVYHVPLVVPLTHRLRLLETHDAHVTLEEVYEESCFTRGSDPDQPLLVYRDLIRKVQDCENSQTGRLKVFNDICNHTVPDYLLSRYIHRSLPAQDQLWAFKKEFAAQLALHGFLSYVLKIGDRSLQKMAFFKQSGRVVNVEFYPAYGDQLSIENHEQVPFRLTRNLTNFLNPFVVDGIFASVLCATNSCFFSNSEILKNYLFLFIRDDLISWNATKMPYKTDGSQRSMEKHLREKISANVAQIFRRLQSLNTQPPADRNGRSVAIPPNHKINQLIETATSKAKLSMMGSTWAPWF